MRIGTIKSIINSPAAPRLAALAGVAIWGASFAGVKLLLPTMPAILVIIFRCIIGAVSLLLISAAVIEKIVLPKTSTIVLFAFIGMFLHQLLQTHGLKTATASASGMLVSFIPVWTALIARVFLQEKLATIQWFGIFLAAFGVTIVLGGNSTISLTALNEPETIGLLFVFASTVTWAIYTICGRLFPSAISTLSDTAFMMLIGAAMLAVIAPWDEAITSTKNLSFAQWSALIFLGVFASGLAFWSWNYALRHVKAAEVASLLHLEPLVAALIAVWWLGEILTVQLLLGGAVIIAGVAIVQRLILKPKQLEKLKLTLGVKKPT